MSVQVRWFVSLARRTRSKQPEITVDWRQGLRPIDIFLAEGLPEKDLPAVLAVVNGEQGKMDVPLSDGDSVEFLVNFEGGSA